MSKAVLGAMVLAATAIGADKPAGRGGRSVVWARNGMVATSQPLAAQIGLRVLQQGGNAVDAAIATAAALAVVEPMSTGLGGDVFALVYTARTGKIEGLNASGFSPQAATRDFFLSRGMSAIPMFGPFSVSVPGAVDGWTTLLAKHGTVKLDRLLAPAIELAERGFPVSEVIASEWASYGMPRAQADAEFARAYFVADDSRGHPPAHGEIFVNQPLAATLRKIAAGGRDAFYKGEVARRIVERLNRLEWPITLEDLAYQRSDWVEPISTIYKGHQVYELGPNTQGMAVLTMLNLLESFDLPKLGHNTAAYLHLLIEAKKVAFADLHAWNADPEKTRLPVDRIISKEYARQRRALIQTRRAAPHPPSGIPSAGDTAYLTVVDKDRNAVSFISSIFQNFGSGVVVPETGIILQDRGALFTLDPKHPNRLEGRKRPYHTIIPAMVFRDGKPWLTFGLMGGDMQPQGHAQVLLNLIEFGMNVQEAGEAARFHHGPSSGVTLEPGAASAAEDLAALGHIIGSQPVHFGGYQAIQIDWKNGTLAGGSDPRKDGCAVGW